MLNMTMEHFVLGQGKNQGTAFCLAVGDALCTVDPGIRYVFLLIAIYRSHAHVDHLFHKG